RPRRDVYLQDPTQSELGVKQRGGQPGLELKGLIAIHAPYEGQAPFLAPVEIWRKWTLVAMSLDTAPVLVAEKTRWLRTFDTCTAMAREVVLDATGVPANGDPPPVLGCHAELTQVVIAESGALWWTFGLESFGSGAVIDSLQKTVAELTSRRPPSLGAAESLSYPAWLSKYGTGRL
ncbi:MAG TPA: hypothetical protein VJR58_26505, partial [Vineibacter sp.]|nr:hypothetical protein [Vineibacter sp.]